MTIGVLSGGQLGRMLGLAGIPLGHRFHFFDASTDACAQVVGDLTTGNYDDHQAIQQAFKDADVITYEWENVPLSVIESLEQSHTVHPSSAVLAVTQDRIHEKELCSSLNIPVGPYASVNSREELKSAMDTMGMPCILKTRRDGYDGKGQVRITNEESMQDAAQLCESKTCILEAMIHFERELSIIGTRGTDGSTVFYPLVQNEHRNGILHISRAPAEVTPELQAQAENSARALLNHFGYVGTMAVEFFEHDGSLLLNEIAPRVHNSGHWTIEGATTSQFENHIRAITGMPLGSTTPRGHSAMINIIGSLPSSISAILNEEHAHLHLYDKAERPGRKIGHITITHAEKKHVEDAVRSIVE